MPVFSAIFLVAALVLAVVLGPQTRPWTWGPAMAALGIAVLAAVPVIWKRGKAPADFGLLAAGTLTAAWFAWRAWVSPVAELGQADLLLVGGAVGAFVSIRAITGNPLAERILSWGIALLLLANLVVIGKQMQDPGFSPVFQTHASATMVSGFFAHYNEAANYLIASAMLVAAAALFGRHALATRMLWLLLALAGLAGVWFTRSRGGIFGAAVGCGVFAAIALMLGKRRDARWFAPALVAIPVIGLAIGAFLFMGWQDAQETRRAGTGIEQLLDNSCRLYFLGIATSCIRLHPWLGGGSRSFSWECFRFVDAKAQGDIITHRPELVHNEWIQSATDYGLAGAGLLAGWLGVLALAAILRVLFEETPKERDSRDAWRLGALAGLAGMLVQSCFSFVFHLLPGILLLGICLGQMSRSTARSPNPQTLGSRMLLSIAAIACAALLLPAGWLGIQVTRILWPTWFSQQAAATSAESRIDALSEAIGLWPQAAFYQERAAVFQSLAGSNAGADFRESAERAIDDYQEAARRHPYDPRLAVNRAILLSQVRRDAEAEQWYAKAIQLQGGMEPGFRSHFSLANHYLRKGLRQFRPDDPRPALAALELSAEQIETAAQQMHWVIADMREPRVSIHESLGTVREAAGDRAGALESYNFAAKLEGGTRAHYRAAVLIGKMAVAEWAKRRPSEALTLFIDARKRIGQAGNALPQGVTLSQRVEYLAYLDRTIAFLTGAKIEPVR
jgi:tetratricopeptide (TPR) repeat protein